ncbi:hypothetical protein [Streptomyces yangpuensis]|uniref:hypothetical protein n=1 Tax=Streptomyces yangpuensis TaxID=1648182 RepID=UPI0006290476|nr:hypothetical protein [Streptomyces yangpuensis]
MRIRRTLAAVIATAALAGLGLAGAATATAAPTATVAGSLTPGECEKGGGTVDWATNTCKGGTGDGQMVD